MGDRRDLLGEPEMPVVHARTLSVSFSERVVDHVKKRKDKIHSWFMDMNLLLGYWNAPRAYHGADQFARAARGAAAHPRGGSKTPGRAICAIMSRSRPASRPWG